MNDYDESWISDNDETRAAFKALRQECDELNEYIIKMQTDVAEVNTDLITTKVERDELRKRARMHRDNSLSFERQMGKYGDALREISAYNGIDETGCRAIADKALEIDNE